MTIQYFLVDNTITVFVNGTPLSATQPHPNFNYYIEGVKNTETDAYFLAPPTTIKSKVHKRMEELSKHKITVCGDTIIMNGYPLPASIIDQFNSMLELDLPVSSFVKFVDKLNYNPLASARDELYLFLSKSNLPITENGNFLAYKVVRSDFMDKYSGTIDNSIGQSPSTPRSAVDPSRTNTCSYGLHFCSFDYIKEFITPGRNDRVMMVEVDPSDVIAIPLDYNNTKGRTCRYTVVSDVTDLFYKNNGTRNDWGVEITLDDLPDFSGSVVASGSIGCPECGSPDTIKKGTNNKGHIRRKCKDCGHHFHVVN